MTRRDLLRAGFALGGIAAVSQARLLGRFAAQEICPSAGPLGELVGRVPFVGTGGAEPPYGELVGGPGLDARQFTDLSDLAPGRLITPTNQVFIRTTAPHDVHAPRHAGRNPAAGRARRGRGHQWQLRINGLVQQPAAISIAQLSADARPMGVHLIECAGNTDPRNYGLMSAAEWAGVPLHDVIRRVRSAPGAAAVRVTGLDPAGSSSGRSVPGASWILPLDTLEPLGAFLAVGMNGGPLAPDHGAPVRLVVPGWYGCAWIKWASSIELVDAEAPATAQMQEFAGRTHQRGMPRLAREFAPPEIDLAATPVRIEKRRVAGRLEYRIVGIVWGGNRVVDRLLIRFSSGGAFEPLAVCPPPRTHRTWALWEHRWRPARPGVYDIVLKAADPAIRTRRLDVFFYVRRVVIEEV